MNKRTCVGILLLAGMMVCGGCSKSDETAEKQDEVLNEEVQPEGDFRDGDLVLRCGTSPESRAVMLRSGSFYSHIGILRYNEAHGEWDVIHAVPGEAEEGEPEYLKKEPITEFYSPERASAGAWIRINCSDTIARLAAEYCERKYAEKLVFDNDYLLSDTTQLYCCELVWQAYLHQGIDISDGKRHPVGHVVSREGVCIFPEDIKTGVNNLFVQPFKNKHL